MINTGSRNYLSLLRNHSIEADRMVTRGLPGYKRESFPYFQSIRVKLMVAQSSTMCERGAISNVETFLETNICNLQAVAQPDLHGEVSHGKAPWSSWLPPKTGN